MSRMNLLLDIQVDDDSIYTSIDRGMGNIGQLPAPALRSVLPVETKSGVQKKSTCRWGLQTTDRRVLVHVDLS